MPGQVTVGCKLPNGLILREFKMETKQDLVMGGGTRDVQVAVATGRTQHIKGIGRLDRPGDKSNIACGFALTYNVDADLWDNWIKANEGTDMVKNGLIFAHAKREDVTASARNAERQRTGLEPIDTISDPRTPKLRSKFNGGAVSALETASKAA